MKIGTRTVHLTVILIFAGLALFSIRDLLSPSMIIGHNWDSPFSGLRVSYESTIQDLFFPWNDKFSLGQNAVSAFSTKIWWGLNAALGLALNGKFVTQAKTILAMVLGGSLMYFYIVSILKTDTQRFSITFAAFCSGLFFMFSPVFLGNMIGGAYSQLDPMIILVVVLILLEKARQNQNNVFFIVIIPLTFLLVEVSIHNLIFGGLFVLIYIFLIYEISIRKKFTLLFKLFISSCLLQFHWLFPLWTSLKYENVQQKISENISYGNLINNVPGILDAFVANGYIRQFYNFLVVDQLFLLWRITLVVFLITIVYALFFINTTSLKLKGLIFIWMGVYLVFLTFVTGFNLPFGFIIEFLYKNIFLFQIFRSPQWLIMPLTISFSILLGIALHLILSKFSNPRAYSGVLFTLFFILHPTYYYGDLGIGKLYQRALDSSNWYKADHLDAYQVPKDYQDTIEYLKNTSDDSKVLLLPMSASPYFLETRYQRQGSGIDPIITYKPPKPFVFVDLFTDYNGKTLLTLLEKSLYHDDNPGFRHLLGILNIGYIMLKKDYAPSFSQYRTSWNGKQISSLINKNLDQLGEIIIDGESTLLIKLFKKNTLPHFYSPNSFSFIDTTVHKSISTEATIKLDSAGFDNFIPIFQKNPRTVVLSPHDANNIPPLTAKSQHTKLESIKISPVQYILKFTSVNENIPIMFSETFHRAWKIYLTSKKKFGLTDWFRSSTLPEEHHSHGNLYGNFWTINLDYLKKNYPEILSQNPDGSYDFNLVVGFDLHRYVIIGFSVSVITFIGMVIFSAFLLYRKNKKNIAIAN